MSNLKDIQQIQSLIAKGKGMGYLTFDEVNKALPVEMNTPEQFEEIIGIFEQLEIAIVDSEKDGKKISATPTETDDDAMDGSLELAEDEESADYSSRSTDHNLSPADTFGRFSTSSAVHSARSAAILANLSRPAASSSQQGPKPLNCSGVTVFIWHPPSDLRCITACAVAAAFPSCVVRPAQPQRRS